MNCDCPSGVRLARVVVSVTAVPVPSGRVATCTDTPRYWSSLLPPWLTTVTASDVGVRLPLAPAATQAAWSFGFDDHTIR